jgi:hypothetical protein
MNRHERRAAAARVASRAKRNPFYQDYIRHLPQVPIDAPPEPGRVHHLCFLHDDWCLFFVTGRLADCNCDVGVKRHVQPVWL